MATTAKKTKKSVAPFYGTAAVWLGYSFLLGLHSTADFVITALLSVVAFRLLGKIFSDDEVAAKVPEAAEKPASTGNEELDKMIADGEKAISEMRRLNDSIEDAGISAAI